MQENEDFDTGRQPEQERLIQYACGKCKSYAGRNGGRKVVTDLKRSPKGKWSGKESAAAAYKSKGRKNLLRYKHNFCYDIVQNDRLFEECPIYESEHFQLRQMGMEDAEGLFQCYSNSEAAKYFNGDCCGDDFYYMDFSQFVKCMEFWESRYLEKDFVRFTVIDIELEKIIGMA